MQRYAILKEWKSTTTRFPLKEWVARNLRLKPHIRVEIIEFSTEDNILEDLLELGRQEREDGS